MFPRDPARREPAINLPAPLVAFILLLLVIHAIREFLLADATDVSLLLGTGFIPAQWTVAFGWAETSELLRPLEEGATASDLAAGQLALGRYLLERPLRPWSLLTHAFLHGSWLHVGLNVVWLAAFGTPVLRRLGTLRFAALSVVSAIGGAAVYWLFEPHGLQLVIGASGIVSGVMGAAALFVFPARPGEPADLRSFVRNRQALVFVGLWLVFNVAAGLFAVPVQTAGGIAWQAHIGGLLAGMLAFPLLDPWRRGAIRA